MSTSPRSNGHRRFWVVWSGNTTWKHAVQKFPSFPGHDLRTRSGKKKKTNPQDVAPMVVDLQRRLSRKRIMDLHIQYIIVDSSASSYSPVHLITQYQRSWMFYNHLKENSTLLFQYYTHQSGGVMQHHVRALFTFNILDFAWKKKKKISEKDKRQTSCLHKVFTYPEGDYLTNNDM